MKTIIFICAMLTAYAANARPVSYPTGWTAMQLNDAESNSLHIHYSPTAKYSVGYKAEYMRDEEWQFHGAQLNNLVKRINKPASQANFYLKSGVGIAHSDYGNFSGKKELAAFTGIALDWEDRRYFTSYENRAFYAGDIDKSFAQKARVGIAPYIGDYGDLHTWLMLQADHTPKNADKLSLTPMVRMFKGPYLGEFGVSNKGKILFNLIARF